MFLFKAHHNTHDTKQIFYAIGNCTKKNALASGSGMSWRRRWRVVLTSLLLKVALVAGYLQRCPSSIRQQVQAAPTTSGERGLASSSSASIRAAAGSADAADGDGERELIFGAFFKLVSDSRGRIEGEP